MDHTAIPPFFLPLSMDDDDDDGFIRSLMNHLCPARNDAVCHAPRRQQQRLSRLIRFLRGRQHIMEHVTLLLLAAWKKRFVGMEYILSGWMVSFFEPDRLSPLSTIIHQSSPPALSFSIFLWDDRVSSTPTVHNMNHRKKKIRSTTLTQLTHRQHRRHKFVIIHPHRLTSSQINIA